MENCLFFGNGINRCFSNGSWSGLLEELANEYFVNYGMINSPTIAYESIYLSIISQNISVQDSEILQKIKDVTTLNNGYKKVYSKFLKLPIEYILTTNYDYAIECSSCNSFTDENYK
ncbi:MAG: hypothetical protein IKH10_00350, partial [Bacteroidetes bacterium]|nr:hypothetical protein [Bacteroidota bacterium]